ncbi:hypothetical protein [Mastigocladopsis repens]|uniref:hypothetical protein n=1 Tax=Mastigocladopsis repens TaxID=221287 RepID=UPI0002F10A83|nr:hypothetical protein [Mastigocladopsis repens]
MFALSRQGVTASFTACLCMLGVSLLQFPKMQKLLHRKEIASIDTIQREINSEKLQLNFLRKMPSFGYDNIIANWVYLNFVQYFGDDEVRAKTGYSLSPEYFEVILEHDPRFIPAYLGLSSSTSMYAAMPERSIKLMEKGLKSLSPWVPKKSYYVWRYKGIDELLFLGESSMAQHSFEMAADWASHHSDKESKQAASVSQKTAEFLSHNPNSKFARIATWTMVLNHQIDENTRRRAINKIEALGGKIITNRDGTHKIKLSEND